MSKVSDISLMMRETADYQIGWEIAERGEAQPEYPGNTMSTSTYAKISVQRLGWEDFHTEERQP